jgi:hypothetical protein
MYEKVYADIVLASTEYYIRIYYAMFKYRPQDKNELYT